MSFAHAQSGQNRFIQRFVQRFIQRFIQIADQCRMTYASTEKKVEIYSTFFVLPERTFYSYQSKANFANKEQGQH